MANSKIRTYKKSIRFKIYLLLLFCLPVFNGYGQGLKEKLDLAIKQMEQEAQLQHALIGLSIIDSKTGKPVYEHNAQLGMAAASTQKLFTSAAAFELLGKDFRYTSSIGYNGQIVKDSLIGALYIKGSGDPSFGSERYFTSKPENILNGIVEGLRKAGIKKLPNLFYLDSIHFEDAPIPDAWVWEDIGNYYGAGSWSVNWKENQYNLILQSGGKTGERVNILETNANAIGGRGYINEAMSAALGTGDNAYVYLPLDDDSLRLKGSIPMNEKHFIISGATSNGPDYFINDLRNKLVASGMLQADKLFYHAGTRPIAAGHLVYTYSSPALDSIVYWFLKKSINLYGEALMKTIAYQQSGFGSTDKGVELVKDFWSHLGIEKSAINIVDGSGLSPQNRVTADALVKVLQYAKARPWFPAFYDALPQFNGMKMKSGSINGVRAYAGYHKAANGKEYSFAIIVNNFNGSASTVIAKMFSVLDNLK